jgi:hypothetical protein
MALAVMSLAVQDQTVEGRWEAKAEASRQLAVAGKPALVPLGVAAPGAQTAWAGPARNPVARAAAEEMMRSVTCALFHVRIGREKTTKTVMEGTCRIGGRGLDHPPLPHLATAPPRCAASGPVLKAEMQLQAREAWLPWGRFRRLCRR